MFVFLVTNSMIQKLVERCGKWSKLAEIDSIDFLVSLANPSNNR